MGNRRQHDEAADGEHGHQPGRADAGELGQSVEAEGRDEDGDGAERQREDDEAHARGKGLRLRFEVQDKTEGGGRHCDHGRRDDREQERVEAVEQLRGRPAGDPTQVGVHAHPSSYGDRRGDEPEAQHREQVADGQADQDIDYGGAEDDEGCAEDELRARHVFSRIQAGEVPRPVVFVLTDRELLGVHAGDLPVELGCCLL